MQLARVFFFLERNRISFITKILAADELRSHVTITLRDKSRYDLIVHFFLLMQVSLYTGGRCPVLLSLLII